MPTCFFIGHREAGAEVLPALEAAVERQIRAYGVTDFVVGRYGNFDRMAALAVRRAKESHPGVTLTLLLPYHPFDRPVEPPPETGRSSAIGKTSAGIPAASASGESRRVIRPSAPDARSIDDAVIIHRSAGKMLFIIESPLPAPSINAP